MEGGCCCGIGADGNGGSNCGADGGGCSDDEDVSCGGGCDTCKGTGGDSVQEGEDDVEDDTTRCDFHPPLALEVKRERREPFQLVLAAERRRRRCSS